MTVTSILNDFQRARLDDTSQLNALTDRIAALEQVADLKQVDDAIVQRADSLLARTRGLRSYFVSNDTKKDIYQKYSRLYAIRRALRKSDDAKAELDRDFILEGLKPGNRLILDGESDLSQLEGKIITYVKDQYIPEIDDAIRKRAECLLARAQGWRSCFILDTTEKYIHNRYSALFDLRIKLGKTDEEKAALIIIQILSRGELSFASSEINKHLTTLNHSFEKIPTLKDELIIAANKRYSELNKGCLNFNEKKLRDAIAIIINDFCIDLERKTLKSENFKAPIKDNHYEWYLNLAIIREILKQPNLSPSDREILQMQALNAYAKAAPLDYESIENLGLQTTPLFRNSYVYFRCTGNNLMCDREGVAVQNDHQVVEAFKQAGHEYKAIKSKKDLTDYLDELYAKDDIIPETIIDFSELLNGESSKEEISTEICQIIKNKDNDHENKKIGHKLELIAFFKKGIVYKLINPSLSNPQDYSLNSNLRRILNEGYYPTPELMRANILQYHSLDAALDSLSCNQALLNGGITNFIAGSTITSFDDFIQRPELETLINLSHDNAPPYLQVLPVATVNLLRGLENIDQKFESKNLSLLLRVSCFRMHKAIIEINKEPDNFINVRNQLEIIHQEIQMILAITEPYGSNDFQKALITRLQNNNVIPNLGDQVIPRAYLQHSAMRCMSNIIQAVAKQKNDAPLNIARLKDVYYEIGYIKTKGKIYELDGDKSRKKGQLTFSNKPPENTKLDLFICEFHHNISSTRYKYQPELILKYIHDMHDKGLLADKFTILVDATLDDEDSQEIRQLLGDKLIQDKIKNGSLNILLVSSTQKFDMVSQDNYYGGKIIALNNYDAFKEFNLHICREDNQVRGLCYQGLTHLHTHAGPQINQYKRLIKANTRKLYRHLTIPRGIFTPLKITLAEMNDEELPYIDIKMPYIKSSINFFEKFVHYCKENNLPLTQRNSYGFANTNGRIWEGSRNIVFRLTVGLEKEEDIIKYADFFNDFKNYLSLSLGLD